MLIFQSFRIHEHIHMKGRIEMKKHIILMTAFSVCLTALAGCSTVEQRNDETISLDTDVTVAETSLSDENFETGVESETEISQETLTAENTAETSEIVTEAEETTEETQVQTSQPAAVQADAQPQSISVSEQSVTLLVGESTTIELIFMPSGSSADVKWSSTDSTIATVDSEGNVKAVNQGSCTIMVQDKNNPEISDSVRITVETQADAANSKASNSINGVSSLTYISGILIANKTYPLPSDYDPGVDEDAMSAFTEMQQAAYQDGISLYIASGYRSYYTQKNLYENYVARDGQQAADTYSARPGYSEHQTGLAFDLNSVDASFADTPEGKWVAENCYKYGFIIRYPQGKSAITGYMYEPWHIRYLGVNIATSVYQSGLCLEEYLGITSFYEDDTQY